LTNTVLFKRLSPLAELPTYETAGAAGADVRACLETVNAQIIIMPGKRALVPTGLACAIPAGFEIQVRPRSGLSLKHGVTVLNAPGTIDSDYRGPLGVILINHGEMPFTIRHGDRVAQFVVARVGQMPMAITEDLDDTARGQGGYGSTGVA